MSRKSVDTISVLWSLPSDRPSHTGRVPISDKVKIIEVLVLFRLPRLS